MTTAAPSTALVMTQPAFSDAERLALAGFLAGYRGLTREAYALDLRQFTAWCRCPAVSPGLCRRVARYGSIGHGRAGGGAAAVSSGPIVPAGRDRGP